MKENYQALKNHVISKLRKELSKDLTYHTPGHTLSVLDEAVRIAISEKVQDAEELFLLKVACLYHDCGFTTTYTGHEKASCGLARKELPSFGLNAAQIKEICGMIKATKIPQTPHNKLEKIICDADLDYLGTNRFSIVSNRLYRELKKRGMVDSKRAWNNIQVNFLTKHHYFTKTSNALREKQKLKHLEEIRSML
jgi:uncharacterized protein